MPPAPLIRTHVTPREIKEGDGPRFEQFAQFLSITKDSVGGLAGTPMILRPWQKDMVGRVFARRRDGKLKHRQALVLLPRKNGKSALGAGIALYGMFDGPAGGEVYSCAADKEQARIVFGTAKKMIDMNPVLSREFKTYRDVIEYPANGSIYRVLSAEAFTKEGLNPHFVMFDEVHAQPNRELWDVMSLATGSRAEPLMMGISTAGVKTDSTGQDSLCYSMHQYGQRVASGELRDPSFYYEYWGAPDKADHTDPKVWEAANPGFGDIVSPEDFASAVLRTPENEFRTKRLNQWVSTATAWLPAGVWDQCVSRETQVEDGADVVLGFDGSFNNDSTALVVVRCPDEETAPHIDVVDAWEKPQESDNSWVVPVVDVEDAIRKACKRWNVRAIACDPARWARTFQDLDDEGLPMLEFPQSPARMIPATQSFYEAVMNKSITHSGDLRLARHLSNCVIRTDSRGSRISKDGRNSPRKIDLAVAAVMALAEAYAEPEPEPTPMFFNWNDL
jgi:phage terminase large subunit-like protein